MTNPDLAALSAAATQGEWGLASRCGILLIGAGENSAERRWNCVAQVDEPDGEAPYLLGEANAALIVALVNAYRTGNLVQIDREGMRTKVWCAVATALDELDPDARVEELTPEEEYSIADAAIAAILGGEHE